MEKGQRHRPFIDKFQTRIVIMGKMPSKCISDASRAYFGYTGEVNVWRSVPECLECSMCPMHFWTGKCQNAIPVFQIAIPETGDGRGDVAGACQAAERERRTPSKGVWLRMKWIVFYLVSLSLLPSHGARRTEMGSHFEQRLNRRRHWLASAARVKHANIERIRRTQTPQKTEEKNNKKKIETAGQ